MVGLIWHCKPEYVKCQYGQRIKERLTSQMTNFLRMRLDLMWKDKIEKKEEPGHLDQSRVRVTFTASLLSHTRQLPQPSTEVGGDYSRCNLWGNWSPRDKVVSLWSVQIQDCNLCVLTSTLSCCFPKLLVSPSLEWGQQGEELAMPCLLMKKIYKSQ